MADKRRERRETLRNFIAVTARAILSFLLQITGSWLDWRILVGDVEDSEYKSALVQLMLVQALGVTPIMRLWSERLLLGWCSDLVGG